MNINSKHEYSEQLKTICKLKYDADNSNLFINNMCLGYHLSSGSKVVFFYPLFGNKPEKDGQKVSALK